MERREGEVRGSLFFYLSFVITVIAPVYGYIVSSWFFTTKQVFSGSAGKGEANGRSQPSPTA